MEHAHSAHAEVLSAQRHAEDARREGERETDWHMHGNPDKRVGSVLGGNQSWLTSSEGSIALDAVIDVGLHVDIYSSG